MEFSRQEHWSGLPRPPPGDLPNPGIEPVSLMSPAVAGGLFTTSTTWEAPGELCISQIVCQERKEETQSARGSRTISVGQGSSLNSGGCGNLRKRSDEKQIVLKEEFHWILICSDKVLLSLFTAHTGMIRKGSISCLCFSSFIRFVNRTTLLKHHNSSLWDWGSAGEGRAEALTESHTDTHKTDTDVEDKTKTG